MLARVRRVMKYAVSEPTVGSCPICEMWAIFVKTGPWLRDQLLCHRCKSIPRQRALIYILQTRFPDWRKRHIHESSPGGRASEKLARECVHYTPTHFFPRVTLGQVNDGFRCENLEKQTFPDACFDLVITGDVFEHVLDPAPAFAEIARTLRPGGAHVFTVPWYWWKQTLVRARRNDDGTTMYLEAPENHGNPIDEDGSLVVTE